MNGLETTRAARPKPAMFSCQSGTRRLWRIWGTKPLYRDFPNLQTVLRRVGSKGFYDGENNDCDQQHRRHFVPHPVKALGVRVGILGECSDPTREDAVYTAHQNNKRKLCME